MSDLAVPPDGVGSILNADDTVATRKHFDDLARLAREAAELNQLDEMFLAA